MATAVAGPAELEQAQQWLDEGSQAHGQGRYPQARALYDQALPVLRDELAPNELRLVHAIHERARVASQLGEFELASDLYREALTARAQIGGGESPTLGLIRCNYGVHLSRLGQIEASLEATRQGIEEQKAVGDDYIPNLGNLANGLARLGQVDEAITVAEEAITLLEAESPQRPVRLAIIRGLLAQMIRPKGEMRRARRLLEASLLDLETAYGPDHPRSVPTLITLGTLVEGLGDLVRAEALIRQALAIQQASMPGHAYRVDILMSLGRLVARRDSRAGLEMLDEARALSASLARPNPVRDAMLLQYWASLVRVDAANTGDKARLQFAYEELAAASRQLENPKLLHYRSSMELELVQVARELGLQQEAVEWARAAVATAERAYPTGDDINLAMARSQLTSVLIIAGRQAEAREAIAQVMPRAEASLTLLETLTDREAVAMMGFTRAALSLWLLAHDDPASNREALEHILRFRGAATRASAARSARARSTTDASEMEAWAELSRIRSRLSGLLLDGGARPETLEALVADKARVERSQETRLEDPPTVEAVCSALQPGEVRVEIHQIDQRSLPARYLAFVFDDACDIERVDLGDPAEIEAGVRAWREALGARTAVAGLRGAEVTELVYQPLAASLEGAETLLLVPDGVLAVLPWAALPLPGGGFLVERHEVQLVSGSSERARSSGGLLTVGGAAFGERGPDVVSPCFEEPFAPLDATLEESNAVARMWGRRGRVQLTGEAATETAVRAALPDARVVHLATHGFAIGPDCLGDAQLATALPMVRSGLALAASNGVGADPDGRLTAEEISGLNLGNADLVLLSACETGLGNLSGAGEGVLGLQRSFALAGAGAVVMSLWQVPDQATSELMQDLVRGVVRRKLSPATALRQAQLGMLDHQRKRGRVDANAWGAWMLAAPTPIEPTE